MKASQNKKIEIRVIGGAGQIGGWFEFENLEFNVIDENLGKNIKVDGL